MKILVTNDDGIYSSGIFALWGVAKEFGEVNVIAPINEKSAVLDQSLFKKYQLGRKNFTELQLPDTLKNYDMNKKPKRIRTSGEK